MERKKIEELVELYREGLIFFIARYVKDPDLAEDLAEDVFVELILHPDRFRHASSEKTYLYAIGRNKAIDWLRKNSRVRTMDSSVMDLDQAEKVSSPIAAYIPDASHEVLSRETAEELRSAMAELKEEYRTAVYLVYFENMSYEDAGLVMKKSRKQIENLVYRGKQSLREKLGRDFFESLRG